MDNRRIEGTIPEIVVEAEKAILHNMSRSTVVSGFMRNDIDEYPREAIREAVINALAHRDYSRYALGSHIQIRMFSDRLEIDNQGGLFGHLSEDSIGIEAPTARNAALMRMLEDMDIVENRGSGIRAMVEAMRSAHLAPPKFKNNHTSFKVTFYNHTLLDKETLEWLNRFNTIPLNDNQRFALAYLRNPLAPKLTSVTISALTAWIVSGYQGIGRYGKAGGRACAERYPWGAYYTLSEMVLEKQQTEFSQPRY